MIAFYIPEYGTGIAYTGDFMFFLRHPKPIAKRGADVVQMVKHSAITTPMNTRVIVIKNTHKPLVVTPNKPK
jgi:hypothetical protein